MTTSRDDHIANCAPELQFRHRILDREPPRNPHVKAAGDINADGRAEAIAASSAGGPLVWYEFTSGEKHVIAPEGNWSCDAALVDMNGNGRLDVVISQWGAPGCIEWYENPGPSGDVGGLWERHPIGDIRAHDLEIGDIDGDGELEIATRDQGARGNRILVWKRNDADGWDVCEVPCPEGEGLALADLNRDGRLELAIGGRWFSNSGDILGDAWIEHTFAEWPIDAVVKATDMNGNGWPDVVLTRSEGPHRLSWFENPGQDGDAGGPWVEHVIETDLDFAHSLVLCDLDGDGRTDVVTAEMHQSSRRRVMAYRNLGDGLSWERRVLSESGSHNLCAADLNGDGRTEVVGANWSGPRQPVELWEPARGAGVPERSRAPSGLRVSDNRRFLVDGQGAPFFYLGDTAWELFHRLTRDEADVYLATRARQGYTVIQAVILAELDGLCTPTPHGHTPLRENDPRRPDEGYFEHVDRVVARAAELGLVMGLLPTWGDKWNRKWGVGPEIFTPENARAFGEFLGARYREASVIWILGGDRPVESEVHLRILQAMAEGLGAGDGGSHLMTLHPCGRRSSSEFVHDEQWLDFNMLQSGHANRDTPNYETLTLDYTRTPTKPCLDGEPCYEDHPVMGKNRRNPYHDEYSVRKAAYWGLFAGAHGHTYGCHPVWQMWSRARQARNGARTPWHEALHLPGAIQMRHARALLESRPFLDRIPDQSLIEGDPGTGGRHLRATRAENGAYALVYTPVRKPVTVDLSPLSGETIKAWWYDPRTGKATPTGELRKQTTATFTPPATGPARR